MALYEKFYYNGIIRKLTIAFGSLFTNIYVSRKTQTGIEREIVPITFSQKEKFVQKIMQDATHENKPAIKLPHLAFEITNYEYDSERKLSSKRKIHEIDADSSVETAKYHYTPVPYNISFSLHLITKTQEEGLQIIEQILPFFTPDYVITARLTNLKRYVQDIPISLLSVSCEDKYDGEIGDRRTIIWTLDFLMKAYLLGPERNLPFIRHTKIFTYVGTTKKEIEPISNVEAEITTSTEFGVIEGIEGSIFDLTTQNNDGKTMMIEVTRNVDFDFTIEVMDAGTALVNLTGYLTYGRFRKNFSHPGIYPIETKLGQNTGSIDCLIKASTTAGLDAGLYTGEISVENPNTLAVHRVIELIIKVK